jgi:DNA invertase Pin-like site-specific DNA recombinase
MIRRGPCRPPAGASGSVRWAKTVERRREGIAKAKAEKLYKGRQKTAQQHKDTILKLHSEGLGVAAILKQIRAGQDKKGKNHKIGQSSVYQIIADYRKQAEVAAVQ